MTLPDIETSNEDARDRILASQSNLDLVVMRLLGNGLCAELIAEAIAAHCNLFACTKDLHVHHASKRVPLVRERFKSAEDDFVSALEVAKTADLTGDFEPPRLDLKTKDVRDQFTMPLVAAASDNKFLKTYAKVISDAAIEIKRATDLMPALDQASADWWVERPSWTIREFAALSLGRKPVARGKQPPRVPSESSIAAIFREFRERCDQLSRAAKIKKGPEKLPHTSITPSEAKAWAAANDFSFPDLLIPRPPTVYDKEDFTAFCKIVRTIAPKRLRSSLVEAIFNQFFPRARADAYETEVWPNFSTGKGGTFGPDYEEKWEPFRVAIVKAWKSRGR